jgi:nucleotide-binding universal stress UspA family protein
VPRLVVPLDGSALAESAIPWADALAARLGDAIDLVMVVSPDLESVDAVTEVGFNRHLERPEGVIDVGEIEDADAVAILEAQDALAQVRLDRKWHGEVETTVLKGEPGPAIADHADQTDARLIVMATHAREGPARSILGSVAGEVINHTRVPVWAIHPGLPWPDKLPERVLVPLDGSGLSDTVLPVVTALAAPLGWTLVLLTVQEHHLLSLPGRTRGSRSEHLESAAARVRAVGVAAETLVASGGRVEGIVEAVRTTGCGLIAMSTHGRRGLQRWVRGSVTDAVVHQAAVPVLVVRPHAAPPKERGG